MIFFIIFLIIIAISGYFAYLSMKDFYELPERGYGLFLIRNPNALTIESLEKLRKELRIISFERLFKDEKSALVLYTPKEIVVSLSDFKPLELEDYVKVDKTKLGEKWKQFVIQSTGSGFKVIQRTIDLNEKKETTLWSDYKKRKFVPLEAKSISSEELLKIILLSPTRDQGA
jgi:hypothetical protein